jgi:hypothetical protein
LKGQEYYSKASDHHTSYTKDEKEDCEKNKRRNREEDEKAKQHQTPACAGLVDNILHTCREIAK